MWTKEAREKSIDRRHVSGMFKEKRKTGGSQYYKLDLGAVGYPQGLRGTIEKSTKAYRKKKRAEGKRIIGRFEQ